MYIIIYGILGDDDDNNLSIEGPFFHASSNDFTNSEILARELASTKTKNQIIPWVFELRDKETISQAMERVDNSWFQKFKNRTLETYKTIQKDQMNSTCPFSEVTLNKFLTHYLRKD